MKRLFTLIAVFAMMGWSHYAQAYTKDQLNNLLNTKKASFKEGESYTLNMTLFLSNADATKSILKLGEGIYLTQQQGKYLGLSTAENQSPNGWDDAGAVADNNKKTNTLTVEGSTSPNGWFSWSSTKNHSPYDFGTKGAVLTISYDKAKNESQITLKIDNDWTDIVILKEKYLKPMDFNFLDGDPTGKNSEIWSSGDLVRISLGLGMDRFYKIKDPISRKYLSVPAGAGSGTVVGLSETEGVVGCIKDMTKKNQDGSYSEDCKVGLISYPDGKWLAENKVTNEGSFFNEKAYFGLYKEKGRETDLTSPTYIKCLSNNKWLAPGSDDKVVLGDSAKPWFPEFVENINITVHKVKNYYYASIFLPIAVKLPENVYAYGMHWLGHTEEGLTVHRFPLTDQILPAGVPALLMITEVTDGMTPTNDNSEKYIFKLTRTEHKSTEEELAWSTELLFGSFHNLSPREFNRPYTFTEDEGDIKDFIYTFNYDSEQNLGFYQTKKNIAGYRAGLTAEVLTYTNARPSTSDAKALRINFEDMVTAITGVEASEPEAPKGIYGLDGRKYKTLQKGINIVNGKKIVIK
ncbi:MAG: hypothetical protein KBT12_00170 [Bacteroidales bacterium]|nr:hypothetical protein [Candidatus Physcousia equi]